MSKNLPPCTPAALAAEDATLRRVVARDVDTAPIVGVTITHYNVGPSTVVVDVERDGLRSTVQVFTYYPDEISFTEAELIGMTPQDARTLRAMRDMAYLLEPPCEPPTIPLPDVKVEAHASGLWIVTMNGEFVQSFQNRAYAERWARDIREGTR